MKDIIRVVMDVDEYNNVKEWLGDHFYDGTVLDLEVSYE